MNLRYVLAEVRGQPWAILESKLETILDVTARHAGGHAALAIEPSPVRRPRIEAGVAVLPIYGILAKRMNMIVAASGGTSTDILAQQFDNAVRDPHVRAIVLDVDSPGGAVAGIPELAQQIRAARGAKRIVAAVNVQAASAAYWLASQADDVVITESGEAGSIGVLSVRVDTSRADEAAGIRYSVIRSGRFKGESLAFTPATPDELASLQRRADEYYSMFVRDVAAGRGVSEAAVRSGFGEGRMVGAAAAIRERMADRLGSLGDAVFNVARRPLPRKTPSAFTAATPDWLDRQRRIRLLEAENGRRHLN